MLSLDDDRNEVAKRADFDELALFSVGVVP